MTENQVTTMLRLLSDVPDHKIRKIDYRATAKSQSQKRESDILLTIEGHKPGDSRYRHLTINVSGTILEDKQVEVTL